jgi:hypothetical protein
LASLPYIEVNWGQSPRLVQIHAPALEVSAQDLYDTLRDREDDIPNMSQAAIVSAAGKEACFDGTNMPVTCCLHDAQVVFLAGKGVVSSGYVLAYDKSGEPLPPIVPHHE